MGNNLQHFLDFITRGQYFPILSWELPHKARSFKGQPLNLSPCLAQPLGPCFGLQGDGRL